MRRSGTKAWILPCIALLVGALFAGHAAAENRPWDQQAVTKIAVELADAVRDLNHTVRANPEQRVGSSQRRAQYRARENLRLLVRTSRRLAFHLEAGEDMDSTLPIYRRLQMIRRDAERAGRSADIPAPTQERIVNARTLVDQLSAYYGSKPDETELDSEAPAPTS